MNARRNLAHAAVLALWCAAGVLFTLRCLFGPGPASLLDGLAWWLWFAGLAAVTTGLVSQVRHAPAALLVHGGTFLLLSLLPRTLPFSVLRLGLDLLRGA